MLFRSLKPGLALLVDFREPGRLFLNTRLPGRLGQRDQPQPGIAGQRHLGRISPAQFGAVDVDMDQLDRDVAS